MRRTEEAISGQLVPSVLFPSPPGARYKSPWIDTALVKAGGSETESWRKQPQSRVSIPEFPTPNPLLKLHPQENARQTLAEVSQKPSQQYSVKSLLQVNTREEFGWARFLLDKRMAAPEVAWEGFTKSFGNRIKRIPEMSHLGELTWSSIRSINCFRFQGGWLLSQTPALEF